MTPEQAVAWLILEGWQCGRDPESVLSKVWWYNSEGQPRHAIRLNYKHDFGVSTSIGWTSHDFEESASPADYAQYAPQVVDLIIKEQL